MDKELTLLLPTLLEGNQIPNNHSEIPIPNSAHYHIIIANQIPLLDPDTNIVALPGPDKWSW